MVHNFDDVNTLSSFTKTFKESKTYKIHVIKINQFLSKYYDESKTYKTHVIKINQFLSKYYDIFLFSGI